MDVVLEYVYSKDEALAIARLVWVLIFSDNVVNKQEAVYFSTLLEALELESVEFNNSLARPLDGCYESVRGMPKPKRMECAKLLRLAVSSDGEVDLPELSQLNAILEQAALFRVDSSGSKESEGGF
jgi:hypothetical protein